MTNRNLIFEEKTPVTDRLIETTRIFLDTEESSIIVTKASVTLTLSPEMVRAIITAVI